VEGNAGFEHADPGFKTGLSDFFTYTSTNMSLGIELKNDISVE
jgi:hypothetical protein